MSAFACVPLCRFLSHSGSSGSKPRPPPQPRRYVHLSTMTSRAYVISITYSVGQIWLNLLGYPSTFQCFSRWRQQRSIDALRSGESGRLESKHDTSHILELTRVCRAYVSLGTPLTITVLLAALLLLLLWWQPQVGPVRFRIKVARNPTRPQSEWRSQEKQVPEEGLSKGTTASPTAGNKGSSSFDWRLWMLLFVTQVEGEVNYSFQVLVCVWIACNWCHGGRKTAKRDLGKLADRLGQGRQRFGTRETAAQSNRAEARSWEAGEVGTGKGKSKYVGKRAVWQMSALSKGFSCYMCCSYNLSIMSIIQVFIESGGDLCHFVLETYCRRACLFKCFALLQNFGWIIANACKIWHHDRFAGSFLFYLNGPNMLPKYVKTVSLFFMTVQVSECKKRLQWKRWKWGWWGKKVPSFLSKTRFSALLFWLWWMYVCFPIQEGLHCGDFSSLSVFGLKPRSGTPVW